MTLKIFPIEIVSLVIKVMATLKADVTKMTKIAQSMWVINVTCVEMDNFQLKAPVNEIY